ncbi:MAG: hypothetical protein COT85_04930 [Chlamydiae bacterium CG10_big_fil_rev_8_21_14_0_10_42_34]|nr:MAG: hypothetical protein COT85_04930 [Chlamydiae bacterium CG10_big_fil_rev_8_21_14_0_10_42_34]
MSFVNMCPVSDLDLFESFVGVENPTYGTASFFGGRTVTANIIGSDKVMHSVTYSLDALKRFYLTVEDQADGKLAEYGEKIQKMDGESLESLSCISLFFEAIRDFFKSIGSFCTKSLDERFDSKYLCALQNNRTNTLLAPLLPVESDFPVTLR